MKEKIEMTWKESCGFIRWMWRLKYEVVSALYLHYKDKAANHTFNTTMYHNKGYCEGWHAARVLFEINKRYEDENDK